MSVNIEEVLLKALTTNKSISLDELHRQYINDRSTRVREATLISYKRHLTTIITWLKDNNCYYTNEINALVMNEFVSYSKKRGLMNNSINKRIEQLKMALIFAKRYKLINENPLEDYPKLKPEKSKIKHISAEYVEKIIDYANKLPHTQYDDRNRLMVYLLFDTGIRKNELRHIKLDNLDLENGRIHLSYTKTGNPRTVYLSDATRDLVSRYVSRYNIEEYLIVESGTNNILSNQHMHRFLDKVKEGCDIPHNVSISFHKFRHTYATQCLMFGANILFVKETLGHMDLNQTQKYVHLIDSEAKNQHKLYSPLNNLA